VPARFDIEGHVPVAVGKCVGISLPPELEVELLLELEVEPLLELEVELAEACEVAAPPAPPVPVEPLDVVVPVWPALAVEPPDVAVEPLDAVPVWPGLEEHPTSTVARIGSEAARERRTCLMAFRAFYHRLISPGGPRRVVLVAGPGEPSSRGHGPPCDRRTWKAAWVFSKGARASSKAVEAVPSHGAVRR
jgi:hypothetical protein